MMKINNRCHISFFSKICLLFLCAAVIFPSTAAPRDGDMPSAEPQVFYHLSGPKGNYYVGRVVDSLTRTPLPSAVVSVIAPNLFDEKEIRVTNYVTDNKGRFKIDITTLDSKGGRLEFSFLGYQVRTIHLTDPRAIGQTINLGDIKLTESPQGIDDVVVKARMQLYKMRGDTTVFFPRAVKTLEGDNALEILRRMPGVEVSESGAVTILGQQVERTYVNDKLIFGEDPTLALRKLEADEVQSILAYDEVDEEDAVRNGENARKRKVLNVITFKDFTRSLQGLARAAVGSEFDRDPEGRHAVRYDAQAEAGYYSEMLQSELKGRIGNIDNTWFGPELSRKGDVAASVSGKAGNENRHTYNASYSYDNNRTERRTISRNIYYSTDYFDTKQSDDTTRTVNRRSGHYFRSGYGYHSGQTNVSASFSGSFGDESGIDGMLQRVDQDGSLLRAVDRITHKRADRYALGGNFSFDRQLGDGNSVSASFRIDRSKEDGREVRDERQFTPDGEEQEGLRTLTAPAHLETESQIRYSRTLAPSHTLYLSTSLSTGRHEQQSLATDAQTGALQTPLSDDAVDRQMQWKTQAGWWYRKEAHSVSLDAGYLLAPRRYENAIFATDIRKTYHLYDLSGSYAYYGKQSIYMLRLWTSPSLPLGAWLSPRINDSNPLFLSAGNPSLRPSKNHTLQFNGNVRGENGSFGYSFSTTLTTDPVVRQRTYFAEATPLPQYDGYVVPAGATLTSPTNAGRELKTCFGVNYRIRIAPIRCFLDAGAGYDYMRAPEDAGEGFHYTHDHRGNFKAELTSDFSHLVRIKACSQTSASYRKRPQGTNYRNIAEQFDVDLRWDLLRRCVFTSVYRLDVNWGQYAAGDLTTHRLDLSLGCRMLDRRAILSLNAYNVLSSVDDFSVSQGALGVFYNWKQNFGRYFTFSFEYKFNSRK